MKCNCMNFLFDLHVAEIESAFHVIMPELRDHVTRVLAGRAQ